MPLQRYPPVRFPVQPSQTSLKHFKILQEPHPPPNDMQALHKHWPSLVHLSTKALKQQHIAQEISAEVDRLASAWKPSSVPEDPHFWQGQIVRGPDIGVGEKDFWRIGSYHFICACDTDTCPTKYHPWTRSLSVEQMLQNDTLTPLLLMREELRPKHRTDHKQKEENARKTIRHSSLYLAAAQKYYDNFKQSSWFLNAVQCYAAEQALTPPPTTHKRSSNRELKAEKRKRSISGDPLPSKRPHTTTSTPIIKPLTQRMIPERRAHSPLSSSNPLNCDDFVFDDDMVFTAIKTRVRGDPIARSLPPAGSSKTPNEIIELTDSESDVDMHFIDWEDQVPFTVIIWTSSEKSYEDFVLHCYAGHTADLIAFKSRLTTRGIDLSPDLEAYNPLSATWTSISADDVLGPFTISNNKPRVFLIHYEGITFLRRFSMFWKVASEIPKSKGKGKAHF